MQRRSKIILAACGLVGLFIALDLVNVNQNYVRVTGRIVEAETTCSIRVMPGVGERLPDYVPVACDQAEAEADRLGVERFNIKKRTSIVYRYASPADTGDHTGTYWLNHEFDKDPLKAGDDIVVNAHRRIASDSRIY